jgi:PadR family transcriptional regulator, regulatory protein PadR
VELRVNGDGQPRNFLRPCLLLLLKEHPDHGYDLLERLRPLGFSDGDPGGVYRTLRALEHAGLVRSDWNMSSTGPARRVYRLTATGEEHLCEWVRALEESRRMVDDYLIRYERVRS